MLMMQEVAIRRAMDTMSGTAAPARYGAVDAQFRLAMRRLAAAVAVITSARDGRWCGMAATSVSSLSMDPPSLLVCINRNASIRPVLNMGQHFAVNLLARAHEQLSAAFGGAASGIDRFGTGRWSEGNAGVPVLADAIAVIECVVDAEIEYGSHSIIIGRVLATRLADNEQPLVYCNGRYQ